MLITVSYWIIHRFVSMVKGWNSVERGIIFADNVRFTHFRNIYGSNQLLGAKISLKATAGQDLQVFNVIGYRWNSKLRLGNQIVLV